MLCHCLYEDLVTSTTLHQRTNQYFQPVESSSFLSVLVMTVSNELACRSFTNIPLVMIMKQQEAWDIYSKEKRALSSLYMQHNKLFRNVRTSLQSLKTVIHLVAHFSLACVTASFYLDLYCTRLQNPMLQPSIPCTPSLLLLVFPHATTTSHPQHILHMSPNRPQFPPNERQNLAKLSLINHAKPPQ